MGAQHHGDETCGHRADVITVLVVSGALGAVIGSTWMATWQVAVESAQALAGVVEYPVTNVFYQYHLKAWTVLHQLLALALLTGFSEYTLSLVVSSMLGALSFASLSLCTYAICRRPDVATLTPLAALFLYGSGDHGGVSYPIFMMGTHHTYGVFGRGMALLAMSMLALGWRRTGSLTVGALPAFHAVWGLWAIVLAGLTLAWQERSLRALYRKYGLWFSGGMALSVASFAFQQYLARDIPRVEKEQYLPYLQAFLALWDGHVVPVQPWQSGAALSLIAVVVAAVWLWPFTPRPDQSGLFIFRMVTLAVVLGIVASFATWIPNSSDQFWRTLMLHRVLNLVIYALPALIIGSIASVPSRFARNALGGSILAYLFCNWFFLTFLSSDKYGWALTHWKAFVAMAFVTAIARWKLAKPQTQTVNAHPIFSLVLAVMLLAGALSTGMMKPNGTYPLRGSGHDPVFHPDRSELGLLITPPATEVVQLRMRQPILLNTGGLDQLRVVPIAGPEMARILERVYGIDLLDPPEIIRRMHPGGLPAGISKKLWETRTSEEWARIGRDLGATHLMAPLDVTIQLDKLVSGGQYIVYSIPPMGAPNLP